MASWSLGHFLDEQQNIFEINLQSPPALKKIG